MTIGIYSLFYIGKNEVYIGQSVEIETRYTRHKWELINGSHTNYKLQKAYQLYGVPDLNILEVCKTSQLNELEQLYTEEFDSINSGYNIVEAGSSKTGINAANSKYSKRQILKVFVFLYKTTLSSKEISNKTNVSIHVVSDIMSKRTHHWLYEKYPEKGLLIDLNRPIRAKNNLYGLLAGTNIIKGTIVSPLGVQYKIGNITHFVSNNSNLFDTYNKRAIANGLSRVLNKTRHSYKGWTSL